MYIGIDFDGTCVTHEFPEIGRDIGAVPVLKKLVEAGHQLILFTMRCDLKKPVLPSKEIKGSEPRYYLSEAVKWFSDNGIPLYGANHNPDQYTWTTSPKPYCHIYIDDAALGVPLVIGDHERPYVNWKEAEKMLQKLQALPINELIKCPNCNSIEKASVVLKYPFDDYTHKCDNCGYWITESEWESAF